MSAKQDVESLIDWWREAGVDTAVRDKPACWYETQPARPKPAAAEPAAPTPAAKPMPDTLAKFRDWWSTEEFPGVPAAGRIGPAGDPASGLMLLLDMPDRDDTDSGILASGEVGRLLDRMLAAVGRDRASIYLASLAPAAIPGRRFGDTPDRVLTAAARHHIALAAPKLVLAMGEAACQALCAMPLADARGEVREIAFGGRTSSVIATFHPRFLLRQPSLKAESWKDLQLLLKEMKT